MGNNKITGMRYKDIKEKKQSHQITRCSFDSKRQANAVYLIKLRCGYYHCCWRVTTCHFQLWVFSGAIPAAPWICRVTDGSLKTQSAKHNKATPQKKLSLFRWTHPNNKPLLERHQFYNFISWTAGTFVWDVSVFICFWGRCVSWISRSIMTGLNQWLPLFLSSMRRPQASRWFSEGILRL